MTQPMPEPEPIPEPEPRFEIEISPEIEPGVHADFASIWHTRYIRPRLRIAAAAAIPTPG